MFVVGREEFDSSYYLNKEAAYYNDILQVNIVESYRNLTRKVLAGVKLYV